MSPIFRPAAPHPLWWAMLGLLVPLSAAAYDFNDQFSVSGIIAAAGQCQQVRARLPAAGGGAEVSEEETAGADDAEAADEALADADAEAVDGGAGFVPVQFDQFDDGCRGGLPVQLAFSWRPTERDEFFVRVAYAFENGLNRDSPFRLAPWAADLEDGVRNINGRGRDYLLTAWYRHGFALGEGNEAGVTLGIVDSTDFLDGNAYANDEYTQFMNEVFVNAANHGLPGYDVGGAVDARFGDFSLAAVGINIGENDDGNEYNFWGAQVGWHPQLPLGEGNYRFLVVGTSAAFLDPAGINREARLSWGLSFDQAVGEVFGLFLRTAWQQQDAAVDYQALVSGGVNIAGQAWGREQDNIGIGYAWLDGGNTDVRQTNVFEAYYRAAFAEYFAVTADVQYMSDDLVRVAPDQRDPAGWLFGLRATVEF